MSLDQKYDIYFYVPSIVFYFIYLVQNNETSENIVCLLNSGMHLIVCVNS